MPGVRSLWACLDSSQRRTLVMMAAVVLGLHVLGFLILFAVVAPSHYALGRTGVFTVGIGLTAYTLGLRHAFDADHISAIDNTTRKLMQEGKRPLSRRLLVLPGSLEHRVRARLSHLVGVRALDAPVRNGHSGLHQTFRHARDAVSGAVPVPDRRAQHRHPARDHPRVPRDADRAL